MGEEKEILLHRKVCAYLTCRLMGDPLILFIRGKPDLSFSVCERFRARASRSLTQNIY